MKLGIGERLMLQQALPSQGNIITLKIVRDLQVSLGFSEEEFKEANIKQDGNRVVWGKEIEKDVEIGPQAMTVIVTALQELNRDRELTLGQIDIYEKFCKE